MATPKGETNFVSALIFDLLLQIFAPDSVANSANSGSDKIESSLKNPFLGKRVARLQAGDLVLVKTPGRYYSTFRHIAGSEYDHLAVVLDNDTFLHVGPPRVRVLPVHILMDPKRMPLVFRPRLTKSQKQTFVTSLKALEGKQYHTVTTYLLIAKLWKSKLVKRRATARPNTRRFNPNKPFGVHINDILESDELFPDLSQESDNYPARPYVSSSSSSCSSFTTPPKSRVPSKNMICTDAIIQALMEISPEFKNAINTTPLETDEFEAFSINDIMSVRYCHERLLSPVDLPPPPRAQLPIRSYSSSAQSHSHLLNPSPVNPLPLGGSSSDESPIDVFSRRFRSAPAIGTAWALFAGYRWLPHVLKMIAKLLFLLTLLAQVHGVGGVIRRQRKRILFSRM